MLSFTVCAYNHVDLPVSSHNNAKSYGDSKREELHQIGVLRKQTREHTKVIDVVETHGTAHIENLCNNIVITSHSYIVNCMKN